MKMDNVQFNFELPKELWLKVNKKSELDSCSMSSIVRRALMEYFKKYGSPAGEK